MSSPDSKVLELTALDTPKTAAEKIDLRPRPESFVLLLGDFDSALNAQMRSLCSRVIAPIAVSAGTAIVDNGSASGCAAVMGQGACDQDEAPLLVGIVPHDGGAMDTNHTQFVRMPAEWTDPAKATIQMIAALAKDNREKPVSAILFRGGEAERMAVVQCVRRNWPVVVMNGTGGLADEIAKAVAAKAAGDATDPATDPSVREIVDTSDPYVFSLGEDADHLRRFLMSLVERRRETLADAWERYDELDQAAIAKQKAFRRLEFTLIVLAVIATLLAVVQSGNALPASLKSIAARYGVHSGTVHILIVLTPIVIAILTAFNSRFREGNKWILLRAAAEAIKREIFRYRARAGDYSDDKCSQSSRESKLAAKIKDLTSALEQSDVNKTSLGRAAIASIAAEGTEAKAALEQKDRRLEFLTPEAYLQTRIEDQIRYFAKKTRELSRQLTSLQLLIYVVGGVGTFLAAIHLDVWVALATAIVTALTSKLGTDQVENSLVQYNQTMMSLRNIESWWKALSLWEKERRTNIDLLVDQTEKTLETETAGWVQQMQTALDKMTEKEPAGGPQGPSQQLQSNQRAPSTPDLRSVVSAGS